MGFEPSTFAFRDHYSAIGTTPPNQVVISLPNEGSRPSRGAEGRRCTAYSIYQFLRKVMSGDFDLTVWCDEARIPANYRFPGVGQTQP